MANKLQLPLDTIEVMDDEILFVLGGAAILYSVKVSDELGGLYPLSV